MADKKNVEDLMNTPDTTAEFDQSDIDNNKVMGVLSYLGILVIIPLLAAKESKFARFHANQGLILVIVEILAAAVLGIFSGIPLIGWIFSIASSLLGLATLVLAIIGIVNVVNGKAKELPIIGGYKLLK